MKFYLIVVAFLFSGMGFSQSYSKVKIILDKNGLEELSELGIPVDHGIHKSGYFFISDFSENEIQRIADNGFDYEILVDDVKSYYAKQNQLPIFQAMNVSCTQNNDVLPAPPVHHFENDSYAGFYKYQDMLNALDSMAILYPNLITTRAPISTFLTHEGRSISTKLVGQPFSMNRTPSSIVSPPPRRGQHTEDILAELGIGDSESLKQNNVI